MHQLIKKSILVWTLIFSAFTIAYSDEYDAISDHLALNIKIDPTRAFLESFDDMMSREHLVNDILGYAKTFVGTPYRRGSKGPKAFDCSGFTSYIFKNFDISLSSSSRAQFLQGEKIETEEVEPGDLLFFSGRANSKSVVGHVGIALSVDDQGVVTFIHAATSGGVRLDKYPDGGYYSKRYIGAKRVIE